MKTITKSLLSIPVTLAMLLFSLIVSAQVTNKINYQAVARDNLGSALQNQNIGVRLNIRNGSGGPLLYQESHTTSTNQFGVFTLQIGNGTVLSGTYNSINWRSGNQWIEVEMDPAGGTSYTSMGQSELLSVPYSMYAASNDQWKSTGNDISNFNGGNVGIGTTTPSVKLQVDNGSTTSLTGGGYIMTNTSTVQNVVIDAFGMMARNNGVASDLRLNSLGGNVGIGTTAPSVKLQVDGGSDANLSGGGYIMTNSVGAQNVVIDDNEIMARNDSAASTLTLNNNGGNVIINGTNATGNVGIGTNSPTEKLQVEGNMAASGNLDVSGYVGFGSVEKLTDGGTNTIASNSNIEPLNDNSRALGSSAKRWTEVWSVDGTINTSDARDKINIQNIHYGLSDILKLKPVSFQWKNRTESGTKIGLLAQDIQVIIPEVVRDWEYQKDEATGQNIKVPTERLGVLYSDLIPVIIKGLQDQQKIIDDLKAEIAGLKQQIQSKKQ